MKISLAELLARIPGAPSEQWPQGERYAPGFEHGSMSLGFYAPAGADPQKPHKQDEIYIVHSGTATLVRDGDRVPLAAGDAVFVAAGMEHCFEEFSSDFSTWVVFWGVAGGEPSRVSPVTVRPAVAAEREHLEALQRRAALSNEGDRAAMQANPDAIQLPMQQIDEGCVYVAEWVGGIKGFSVILAREDGDVELDGLFVEPACWRQGIGRALLEHAVSVARNRGAKHLHALGNTHAEAFYRACGFEVSGTTPTRFGSALLMKKAVQ